MPGFAELIGYSRAPTASYMVRHPVKGTRTLIRAKGMKGLVTTRAGAALGGMVALPLALAWGRRRTNAA